MSQKISHSAFSVLIISIILNSLFSEEVSINLKKGEEKKLSNYFLKFENISKIEIDNFTSLKAEIHVTQNDNKLKFYPNILEVVVFGAGKERCVAFINIDLSAVGNWAERNNIAYSSYQELAGHPKVLDMIQSHVQEVNEAVAKDQMLSGCQIHRFLVLHKELDADDGELTRTRKVRRKVISDKFADLVGALYDNSTSIYTETEVTYEDGRKGKISANLEIRDAQTVKSTTLAAQ